MASKSKYKRVLLKLSGESLKLDSGKDSAILDADKMKKFAAAVKKITSLGVELALVIGGGNIYRGKLAEDMHIDKTTGDFMGMISTIINSLGVQSVLNNEKIPTKVLSALPIEGICEKFSLDKALKYFKEKNVVIFAGGTGNPNFTTDTAASLRALETSCDAIIMGKNGTKGVYDKDPNKYKDAKFIKKLTFNDLLKNDLKIMDLTAASLLKDADIKIHVIDISNYQNIIDVLNGKDIGSVVKKGE